MYKQQYIVKFIDKLKEYSDDFFEKDILHKNTGKRGSWASSCLHDLCFQFVKAQKKNNLKNIEYYKHQLLIHNVKF